MIHYSRIYTCRHTHVCTYVDICVCVRVYAYMCACAVCVCMLIYVCMHTLVHICVSRVRDSFIFMLSWLTHAWKLIHKCKWSWWQEVEVIKLVNEIMGQILHPVSTRAFVAGLLETMGLLMLLVKMERNDVLAGLSKAVVAFYDAVLGFEKVAVCCNVLQCVAVCFFDAKLGLEYCTCGRVMLCACVCVCACLVCRINHLNWACHMYA